MTKKMHSQDCLKGSFFQIYQEIWKIMVYKKVKELDKKMEKFSIHFRIYIILMMLNLAHAHTHTHWILTLL